MTTTDVPDVTDVESLQDITDPLMFAGKQLLVDLADCPPMGATAKQPQPNPLLDNVEAMMLGKRLGRDRHELFLLSDDNSNPTQITRLYRLAVDLPEQPTLRARALYDATDYQPGTVSGTQLPPTEVNGVTPPFDGQPISGFSAMIPADAHKPWGRRLLAMPDNGFGAKDNSAEFLLRAYEIESDYRDGDVEVHDHISFRDPDQKLPFPIVNDDTSRRLLTGADFDIESLARDARGDLWIGEEFGPYLVKTDSTGKVLRAPIPLPDGGKSPQSPDLEPGETPTVPASRGFEAMAVSEDGWTLYPILEGARTDDPDQRRRTSTAWARASPSRWSRWRWCFAARRQGTGGQRQQLPVQRRPGPGQPGRHRADRARRPMPPLGRSIHFYDGDRCGRHHRALQDIWISAPGVACLRETGATPFRPPPWTTALARATETASGRIARPVRRGVRAIADSVDWRRTPVHTALHSRWLPI